jgi:hypothetical protein
MIQGFDSSNTIGLFNGSLYDSLTNIHPGSNIANVSALGFNITCGYVPGVNVNLTSGIWHIASTDFDSLVTPESPVYNVTLATGDSIIAPAPSKCHSDTLAITHLPHRPRSYKTCSECKDPRLHPSIHYKPGVGFL